MGLLDEVAAQPRKAGNPEVCAFARAVAHLPPQDRAELDAALAGDYPHTAILRVLHARGVNVKYEALRYHRNGSCCCEHR